MLLLIDGYNLLHQSDLMGRGRGERWLQRARERLLRQLQRTLDDSLAAQTCVVFDAESPPPDRPHEYVHFGIRVLYAVGYPEADDLIEELIARHDAPQRLTVVSSDHRLQRAARRRRAHAFDADAWYHRLLETGPLLGIRWPPDAPQLDEPPLAVPEKLEGVADEREVEAWIEWFEQAETPSEPAQPSDERQRKPQPQPQPTPEPEPNHPSQQSKTSKERDRTKEQRDRTKERHPSKRRDQAETGRSRSHDDRFGSPDKQIEPLMENPFPEGYAEDLLEGED